MAWADLVLAEDRLATMLAACQPWRAIVANPNLAWSQLAAVIDDAGDALPLGDAASKIKTGIFAEEWENPETIDRPRALCTETEQEDQWTRTSTTGHDLTGQVFLLIECNVPTGITSDAAAKVDARRKSMALQVALLSLPRAYPNLDITSIAANSGIPNLKSNNGDWFQAIQFTIGYQGAL